MRSGIAAHHTRALTTGLAQPRGDGQPSHVAHELAVFEAIASNADDAARECSHLVLQTSGPDSQADKKLA
jgi:hypothetical protein